MPQQFRRGGTCRSPISSEDEEKENILLSQNVSRKRKSKAICVSVEQLESSDTVKKTKNLKSNNVKRRTKCRNNTSSHQTIKQERERRESALNQAPLCYIEYLHFQLQEQTQLAHCSRYGYGQGVIVPLPSIGSCIGTKMRRITSCEQQKLMETLIDLGFTTRQYTNSALYRIASSKWDALKLEISNLINGISIDQCNYKTKTTFSKRLNTENTRRHSNKYAKSGTYDISSTLSQVKTQFEILDSQTLEIVDKFDKN